MRKNGPGRRKIEPEKMEIFAGSRPISANPSGRLPLAAEPRHKHCYYKIYRTRMSVFNTFFDF
jgi:hypothetical protein